MHTHVNTHFQKENTLHYHLNILYEAPSEICFLLWP